MAEWMACSINSQCGIRPFSFGASGMKILINPQRIGRSRTGMMIRRVLIALKENFY